MRKFFGIILILILILVACKKQDTTNEAKEVMIEYWSWDPELREQNEALITEFEAMNPGVTVKLSTYEPKDYWTKLPLRGNQQNLPDVFNLSSGYIEEWSQNGFLRDLTAEVEADINPKDFYFSLFEAGKDLAGDNHYYALPYALVTTVLYYNKDMFDAAGLSYPAAGWTWADFSNAAQQLTQDTTGDGKTDQWGFWFYGRYSHIESWIYSNNGNLINRSNNEFSPDKNALDSLKFLTDLVLVSKVAPPQKDMTAFRHQDVFPQGEAAMWVDGSWNIANNRSVAGSDINWDIAPIPQGPNYNGTVYGWSDYIAISPTSTEADMAWKFAKYLIGEGLSMDMYLAGKIPSYIALTESEAFLEKGQQPENKAILRELASHPMRTSFTQSWGEWRGYGEAERLGFEGYINNILNGDKSFDIALKETTENINLILDRTYNR